MTDFVMFGYSHLFGDILDCISSRGDILRVVYLNVPEVTKPGRPTLYDRLARLRNIVGYDVRTAPVSEFRPDAAVRGVIGFSRAQAGPLIDHLEKLIGIPIQRPLVHTRSIRQIGSHVGAWSIVNAGAILGSWSTLGRHVIVNRGANIGHDVEVGDHSFISPGAVICGHAKLGRNVFIGANATILPDVRIGDDATIGAGAVVTYSVDPGKTFAGVPAEELRS